MNETILWKKGDTIRSLVLKIIAVLASCYGMARTFSGPQFLTFFTNLSNIFVDVVMLAFIGQDIQMLQNGGKKPLPNGWYVVKFMATISITLTFLVYLLLLAPTNENGIIYSYFHNGGGSFGVHFVMPVLAIVDFMLFDYRMESNRKHVLFAVIPPLCYVVLVVILAAFGMRWYGNMYAPYNFLNFGAPTGWFGFDLNQMGSYSLGIGVFYMIVILLFIFLGIGRCYLSLQKLRRKHILSENVPVV